MKKTNMALIITISTLGFLIGIALGFVFTDSMIKYERDQCFEYYKECMIEFNTHCLDQSIKYNIGGAEWQNLSVKIGSLEKGIK